jgi:hypothetical protein
VTSTEVKLKIWHKEFKELWQTNAHENIPCFITVECITTLHFCVKGSETSEFVGDNSDVPVV